MTTRRLKNGIAIFGILIGLVSHQTALAFCTIYMNTKTEGGVLRRSDGYTRLGAMWLGLFEPRSFSLDIYTEGLRPEVPLDKWLASAGAAATRWNTGDGVRPLVYRFDPVNTIDSEDVPVRANLISEDNPYHVVAFDDIGDLFLDLCVDAPDHGETCLDRQNVLGVTLSHPNAVTHVVDFSDSDVVVNGRRITRVLTERLVIDVGGHEVEVVDVVGIEKERIEWTGDPFSEPGFDLESTLTHELGHVLGLAHAGSGSGCREDHPEAVMWDVIAANQVRRDLTEDDLQGELFLYEGRPPCADRCRAPWEPACVPTCTPGEWLDLAPVILDTTEIPDQIQDGEPFYPMNAYILGNRDGEIGHPFLENRVDPSGGDICWMRGDSYSGEMMPMRLRHYYEFPIPAMDRDMNFWPGGTRVHYGVRAFSALTGHPSADPADFADCYQFLLLTPPHQVGEPYFRNEGLRFGRDCELDACRPVLHNIRDSSDVQWVDYDNDRDLDLFVINRLPEEGGVPLEHLFRNDYDPRDPEAFFTEAPGIPIPRFGMGPFYDNIHGVWGHLPDDDRIDLLLFRVSSPLLNTALNTGDVSPFEIRTHGVPTNISQATLVDFNRDGTLDIATSVSWTGNCERGGGAIGESIRLLEGNPDGSFRDVTEAAGFVPNAGVATRELVWGDYNNDQLPDVLFLNSCADPQLFRNNGDGTFTDVTVESHLGVSSPIHEAGRSHNATWADLDNNGYLDLFWMSFNTGTVFALRNFGGVFRMPDIIQPFADFSELSLTRYLAAIADLACFDYDNDGDEDCYDVGQTAGLNPRKVMFHKNNGINRAGELEMTAMADREAGIEYANWIGLQNDGEDTEGMAVGDYDEDGYLDLFLANSNIRGSGLDLPKLLHNFGGDPEPSYPDGLGHAYHWIKFDLTGSGPGEARPDGTRPSNRSAIGARIFIRSGGKVQNRFVRAVSEHSLPVHFGLGLNELVDRVLIRWPGGILQTLTGLAADNEYPVDERGATFENEPPHINPISAFHVRAGDRVEFHLEITDFEMQEVRVTASGLPRGATFDEVSRIFDWTPAADQAGRTYTIRFTATDSAGGSSSVDVSIEVLR